MRIRPGFNYNEVCGVAMIVPMGESNIDFSKVVSLNDSSTLLWKRMEKGEFTESDLVGVLTAEYEVDDATARNDVQVFVKQLTDEGMIEN